MNLRLNFAAAALAAAVIGGPLHAASPAPLDAAPMPSLAPMVKRVSPSVVNIATRGTIKEQPGRNPLLDDPFFRRFFDTPPDSKPSARDARNFANPRKCSHFREYRKSLARDHSGWLGRQDSNLRMANLICR